MSRGEDDVLVKVEGVSKKFCRSLKKSLWYGVCDIAGELLPGRKRQRVAGSELRVAGEEEAVTGRELLVASENTSAAGPSEIRFALISRANENSWLKSKESAKTFDWPLAFVVQL